MAQEQLKKVHQCDCIDCRAEPNGAVAQEHVMINRLIVLLNEKQRRRFVGLLAYQQGRGGIQQVAAITGLHRNTITRGLQENQDDANKDDRIRRSGGGRKQVKKRDQTCLIN